jgi:hypothetical protein
MANEENSTQINADGTGCLIPRKTSLKSTLTALFILLHLLAPSYTIGEEPEVISVDLHIRAEWFQLAPSVYEMNDHTGAMARSALRTLRAIDPDSGELYDNSKIPLDCDPGNLRRTFRLEKEKFLLGEPILVEFRVELEGPGKWQEFIGGNYRARGRDDNFLFIMRHEDKTWVRDPYLHVDTSMLGGRIGSCEVRRDKPLSYWFPVQRWCAVDKPGRYELYCLQSAPGYLRSQVWGERQALNANIPDYVKIDHYMDENGVLIDSKTGERSERYAVGSVWQKHEWDSPLVEYIPSDVVEHAERFWSVREVADFAHFTITVRQGSDEERKQMIEYWTGIAEPGIGEDMPAERSTAAVYAIQHALQGDFLPLIEKWIFTKPGSVNPVALFNGLAMRSSSESLAMLLRSGDPLALQAMSLFLPSDRIPEVIPQLIEWLTHENSQVRLDSETLLCMWTGQAFPYDPRSYYYQQPTIEEARGFQSMWKAWWEKNKDNFKPEVRHDNSIGGRHP